MNLVEDKIVHLLTGKHNLFEVSVDELQAISDEQPFFSVAQLLLTQKMKQVNHPGFVQQLQKTALFFPNIFWLDKHLQESSTTKGFPVTSTPTATPVPSFTDHQPAFYHTSTPEPVVTIPEPTVEATSSPSYYNQEPDEDLNPIAAQYGQAVAPAEELVASTDPEPVFTEEVAVPAEPEAVATEEIPVPEPVFVVAPEPEPTSVAAPEPEPAFVAAPEPEPAFTAAPAESFVTAEVDEPVTEQKTAEPVAAAWEVPAEHTFDPADQTPATTEPTAITDYTPSTIELVGDNTPESVEVIAQPVTEPFVAPEPEAAATPPVEDASIELEAPGSVIAPDTQEQTAEYEHSIKESFATTINEAPAVDEDDLPVDELGEKDDAGQIPNMRLAEMMQQQADTFHKPVAENETLAIESEPYHTIDYFASQGIKADGAEDGLAKKVRKFTDWLKQMKKVAPQPSDLGTDAELEKVVHGIAATSIEAKEVVTEAMADVLVMQGKIDKAVLLYSKLSFLNPDKTAYFAGKIIELKGN